MLLKIIVVGALLIGVMAAIRDGRILFDQVSGRCPKRRRRFRFRCSLLLPRYGCWRNCGSRRCRRLGRGPLGHCGDSMSTVDRILWSVDLRPVRCETGIRRRAVGFHVEMWVHRPLTHRHSSMKFGPRECGRDVHSSASAAVAQHAATRRVTTARSISPVCSTSRANIWLRWGLTARHRLCRHRPVGRRRAECARGLVLRKQRCTLYDTQCRAGECQVADGFGPLRVWTIRRSHDR